MDWCPEYRVTGIERWEDFMRDIYTYMGDWREMVNFYFKPFIQ
jgi:hypothetical protein